MTARIAAFRIVVLTSTAVLTGIVVSLAAIAFVDAVAWLNNSLLVSPRTRVQFDGAPWLLWLITLLVPMSGGLLVGLLIHYASPEKRPFGPPDVILSVQLEQALPSRRGGVTSTIASVVSLGFGASVGQYGPLVYMGALIGDIPRRLNFNIPNYPAITMACGVAAAIATAFNAPIAGLVFAHEVVLRHYSMQAFAPTTVAAATGYVVANVIFEREPLFLVDYAGVAHGHEFILFALLGFLAAGLAIVFMKLVLKSADVAKAMRWHPVLRPAMAGLAVGLCALWLPDVLGVGKEALRFATIEGAFAAHELAILVVAKIALTALCIGFGFAGGVFSPSLLIGILFGSLFWLSIDSMGFSATSGIVAYAICGMMAMTSAVIGAPLTTILIVFELTHNYDLTIAAMVAVVFSNLLSYRLFGRSLFDVQMMRRGTDLSIGRDNAWLSTFPVGELANTKYIVCHPETELRAVVTPSGCRSHHVFVIDENRQLLGEFDRSLCDAMPMEQAGSVMHASPLVFNTSTSLSDAMKQLAGFEGDDIPLVHSTDHTLQGTVRESTVIKTYLQSIDMLRKQEHAPV